uniref:Uncharacterized protein n=1 Tax=Scleropages formosus TaxID=113540 RepID=A0A8C9V913_SCLFO
MVTLRSLSTCPSRSSWEIKRICTGPGPLWATGGATVTERLGSDTRGRSKGTGGTERARFTRTWVKESHNSVRSSVSYLTDNSSVSVMFQNDFQKCTSRFCVMRSNSDPLSSGSIAYFPEVKKELAATPKARWRGFGNGEGSGK